MVIELDIMLGAIVCCVEIVCTSRKLSSDSVNLFHERRYTSVDTESSHG